ncbi:MAG: ABC transporter permease [Steroidobacteraceae bacterium]
MSFIWTVFRKEFFENLRDRRTILSALIFGPLFGPLLLAVMLQLSLARSEAVADDPIAVAVAHGERAPNLMAFLRERNVSVEEVTLDDAGARAAILAKQHKVVLRVPEDYGSRLAAGEPAPLLIYADSSDMFNDRLGDRIRSLLAQHGQQIAQLRLLARGVDPFVVAPIAVQDVDVATPKSRAVLVLGVLSYLIILAMFMGGMYLAIDSTAGERERGSLEPLFTTPAPRHALVYGKILATASYMLVSLILTVTACATVVQFLKLENFGMSANLGPLTALGIIAVTAPLVLLGAALMTVVASFTKTYREAQTYVGFVMLIPTLPLAFVTLLNLKPTLALMAVPSLSQHFLMNALLREDPIAPLSVAVSAGASLALGLALSWIAARLYTREGILG